MLKNNPLALALLILVGLLLALVAAQMSGLGRRPPALGRMPVDLSSLPRLHPNTIDFEPASRMAQVEKITARPLMSPDRKPEAVEAVAESAEQDSEPMVTELKARLTSVVITPDGKYAIIQDAKSKKRQTISIGMPLEGEQGAWVLSGIEPRKAVFTAGDGKTAELELTVFAKSLPESAASKQKKKSSQKKPDSTRQSTDTGRQRGTVSAEEIRRKIAERRAQLRAEAAKRNNK